MEYCRPNDRTLKLFLTHQAMYLDTLWHDCTNVRIFLDGKLFTRIMPYVNTAQCHWRLMCCDRESILSVTFLIIIYIKDYQEENLYGFPSWQARTNYGKQKMWIENKNKKYWGKVEGMVKLKPSRAPESNESKNPTYRNKGKVSNPKK